MAGSISTCLLKYLEGYLLRKRERGPRRVFQAALSIWPPISKPLIHLATNVFVESLLISKHWEKEKKDK